MQLMAINLDEFIATATSTHLTIGTVIIRLVLSMLLGMIVGYERKRKGQIAGIRTFALMAVGACLAMLLSIYVPQQYFGLKNGDPGRIAAQVITGVGFIGGGAIIQMRGSVRGLTTAAGIWITAIIGMTVGVGMYLSSIITTLLCVTVLVIFERIGNRHHIGQDTKVIEAVVSDIVGDIAPYQRIFDKYKLRMSTYYINYDYDNQATSINFILLVPSGCDMLSVMAELRTLQPTKTLTLSSQVDI